MSFEAPENAPARGHDDVGEAKSAASHAFLLGLAAILRSLPDATGVAATACRALAAHLAVDGARCTTFGPAASTPVVLASYGFQDDPGVHGVPGSTSDAGALCAPDALEALDTLAAASADLTRVFADMGTDPSLPAPERALLRAGIIAGAVVALVRQDDRQMVALWVFDRHPRDWTPSDVRLIESVAERVSTALERLRIERESRDREERLQQFGDASPDVLWIRDARTLQWDYLTPSFETIYGVAREEALRGDNMVSWVELIVPEDRAAALASIGRVARGERVSFEYRVRRPADGEIRWLCDNDFPIRDGDGRVARIGGVGRDVTALKRAEAAMAASRAQLRTLVENMPQLVWRSANRGRWIWAAPQWTAYTGQSDEDSHDLGWLEPLHPDDREAAMAAWEAAEPKAHFEVECRIRQASSGAYRWFQTRGTPVRRADGAIDEWLGTSTDIDDQVRAREYLASAKEQMERRVAERTAELQQALSDLQQEIDEHRQAEERLRQSEKLKAVGQLTGGIAHDFNNTLQGIVSALALVRGRLEQGRVEDALGYVEPAEKAAARAGALTHRLLAFSRQQTLAPRPVDLDQIARGMEDMIRRAVGPAVQVELKSGNGRWLVLCDPNQMESALLNLCINARDAMPEGGWLTISIEERFMSESDVSGFDDLRPGRYVLLAVTDTGTGMTPEVAGRIFEPFFTTKPPGQGIGLGLSQIYGFIRQSGGLVQVETAPGAGTTVRLCLPFHQMASLAPSKAAANGKTILLVEDEHDLRRMLADQLRDLGYSVMEADAADVALRVVGAGTRIDLLVTDIGLRGDMDGRQMAQSFKAQRPGVPVIFITGFAGDQAMTGETVLRKPFRPTVLTLLIKEHLA